MHAHPFGGAWPAGLVPLIGLFCTGANYSTDAHVASIPDSSTILIKITSEGEVVTTKP